MAYGSSGTLSLNYNVHYNSIKAAFLLFGATGSSANFINGQFDSFDTQGGGDYSDKIAGTMFPNKLLSALTGKAQVLTELRKSSTTLQTGGYQNIFKSNNM